MLRIQQRVKPNSDLTLMGLTVQWNKQTIIQVANDSNDKHHKGSPRVLSVTEASLRQLKERSKGAKTAIEVERIICTDASD